MSYLIEMAGVIVALICMFLMWAIPIVLAVSIGALTLVWLGVLHV